MMWMGERRELNPRMVDPQSTTLIHLATSAPTLTQLRVRVMSYLVFNVIFRF